MTLADEIRRTLALGGPDRTLTFQAPDPHTLTIEIRDRHPTGDTTTRHATTTDTTDPLLAYVVAWLTDQHAPKDPR
jgi:hypothetical protein